MNALLPPPHAVKTARAPLATRCPSRPDYEAVKPDLAQRWTFFNGATDCPEGETVPLRKKSTPAP